MHAPDEVTSTTAKGNAKPRARWNRSKFIRKSSHLSPPKTLESYTFHRPGPIAGPRVSGDGRPGQFQVADATLHAVQATTSPAVSYTPSPYCQQ